MTNSHNFKHFQDILVLENIFKNSLKQKVYVFTDNKKTKALSDLYKNSECFITKKFNNKNMKNFNLEADIIPRSNLVNGGSNQNTLVSIAQGQFHNYGMNFMKNAYLNG